MPVKKSSFFFFFISRRLGNEFRNLIGSLRGPAFSISALGHGNAEMSFLFFCLQNHLTAKAFFQNSFLLDKKLERPNLSFKKQRCMTILKLRNSSLQRRLVCCICKARHVCVGGSERIIKLNWERKISYLPALLKNRSFLGQLFNHF